MGSQKEIVTPDALQHVMMLRRSGVFAHQKDPVSAARDVAPHYARDDDDRL